MSRELITERAGPGSQSGARPADPRPGLLPRGHQYAGRGAPGSGLQGTRLHRHGRPTCTTCPLRPAPASHGKHRRDCAHPARRLPGHQGGQDGARGAGRRDSGHQDRAPLHFLHVTGPASVSLRGTGPVHTSQNAAMKEHSDKEHSHVPVPWGFGLGRDSPHLHAGCLCLRPSVWNVLERYRACVRGIHTRGVMARAPQSPSPCIHSLSNRRFTRCLRGHHLICPKAA